MRAKKRRLAAVVLLALLARSGAAAAQSEPRLAEVRRAYAAVDYENTLALAKQALEQGGNDRASTAELYLLLATAAAALDRTDEARDAFACALSVNPELKLDRSLSPKIRAPYQEARGALSRADGRPALEVTLARRERSLALSVHDAQALASDIELGTRSSSAQPFARTRLRSGASRQVALPASGELEYYVRLLDRHGNVLLELGSESEPRRLPGVTPLPGRSAGAANALDADVNRTPYYVTAGALGALGLIAGGVATAMYVRREQAAREWNGPSCEQPGETRAEQCGAVDVRRRSAEHLSIGFATTSGALLVGGLVSLWLAPSAKTQPSVAIETGRDSVVLHLRAPL